MVSTSASNCISSASGASTAPESWARARCRPRVAVLGNSVRDCFLRTPMPRRRVRAVRQVSWLLLPRCADARKVCVRLGVSLELGPRVAPRRRSWT